MINIYDISTTNFNTNGDATLQPIRCELTVAVNGGWSLELEVPYDKDGYYEVTTDLDPVTKATKLGKWNLIQAGAIIGIDISCIRELISSGQTSARQFFRIYDYRKDLNSVLAIAYPIAMECNNDVLIDNCALVDTPANVMARLSTYTNKYQLSTNISSAAKAYSVSNVNLGTAIAIGFTEVFGGELLYNNNSISVRSKLGDQNNASKYPVIYGRNMTGIHYKKDDSGIVTQIHPISQDGIKLNGTGYVNSPLINKYPCIHKRYMVTPYKLVIDDDTDNSVTARATATALQAIKEASMTPTQNVTLALVRGSIPVPFAYIKSIKTGTEDDKGIIESVQDMATAEIYDESFKSKAKAAIKDGMNDKVHGAWAITEHEWTWHENTSVIPHAWWYGYDSNEYARNCYVKIGKYYEYFNDDGYWEEYKRLESIDWYQNSDGSWSIGYREGYYAHNEYVYMTVSGEMQEWWYDSDGWYDDSASGASNFGWHGDSSTGIWFGEEDAGSEDKSKYLHDCWAFIDGTYYFFDQYGYTDGDPVHSLIDYQWGRQIDEKTGKEWFGNTDKSYGAKWLYNQWIKMNSETSTTEYWFVDQAGYVRDEDASKAAIINQYNVNLTSIKTTCNTQKDAVFTLLYQLMTDWCNKQYDNGVDKPTLTLTVSMIDLSKTDEYKKYERLETVCLGDKVICKDAVHGITSQERILGLTYDCIRGYNTSVNIGHTESSLGSVLSGGSGSSVPSGFDTSAIETALTTQGNAIAVLQNGKQDKLRAGDNITIDSNNVISATGGGTGLQYWHETATRFYREGTHEGIGGLADYLKPSTNEIGHWQNGNGWTRCMVTRLKGSPRNVIMGYATDSVDRHPIIVYASTEPLDFEWGWSADTFYSPYGVTTWADKDTYPVPREGYDWYFGWSTGIVTYEGETWYVLLIDTYTWAGGTDITSEDGLTMFIHAWENNPQDIGLTLLQTAHAVPYTTVITEIGTDTYAFKYGGDDKTYAYIDTDGNALFKEITTDAGTLTSQMSAKQNNLIEGDNIQIGADGKTISATDTNEITELVDVTITNLSNGEILKYDAANQKWVNAESGTVVEANPSGTSVGTLNKIAIDGDIYSLPSGGGGGGGSFVGLTKSQYDALPTADKEDTSKLYFVQEGGGTTEVTDLIGASSDWGMYREGSMTITWNSNDEIVFDWLDSSAIGGDIVKIAVIPASASKIRFKITTGSAYDTNTQRFKLGIGVRTTYTTSVVLDGYNVSDWLAFKNFDTINSVWEDELDLSNVTVDTYLYVLAHGWDATVNKLEMVATDGAEATYHTYWNNAKRGQWNQIKELTQAEYNALSTDEKQNGNLYLTHDSGYDFFSYDNGKIIVRTNTTTGERIWFFNGFTKTADDMTVPSELVPYLPTQTQSGQVALTWAWTDDTSTTRNGAIGFLYPGTANVKIRSWNNNYSQLMAGTFWGTLIIDDAGEQHNNYSAPTEGLSVLPNRIYFNNTLYAEKKPSNQITYGTTTPTGDANDGDLYILLDSNNSKQGEYLYMNNAWVQIEGGTP